MGIKIIYVAGSTRSGSTLIDIILGNSKDFFSAGELVFLIRNGFNRNELCSCKRRTLNCSVWSMVFNEWQKKRILSLEEYDQFYFKNFKNRHILRLLIMYFFPNKNFKNFSNDTAELYKTIASVTGLSTIIDSSKTPLRILLLRHTNLSFKVVHIVRSLRGVLYSNSKYLSENSLEGIEQPIIPKNNWYIIFKWIWINLLCILFSIGKNRHLVKYEHIINKPDEVIYRIGIQEPFLLQICRNKGPFYANHLVAGGRIRMKEKIFIEEGLASKENWKGSGLKEYIVRFIEFITS